MSDTDTPITAPPHTLVRDDRGIASWRPVLTTLSVHGVASDHNARHLVVREDGVERFRFKLDADHAAHLARLLAPASGAAA
ncbi:hypothetical protein MMSR116_29290 [Methylobacterium mesophilicum SR1.6/6]|uniref:Uncharacterized protein n=1 Tax=Methylobacterium mesophilicum SR1.6/6 TaxID=908290 RepID=A0A6B9FU31_9HYPH|nr:hypothetical protein MMSR116_29290 [Methylobacterium mesophilicum SR1.6/6]